METIQSQVDELIAQMTPAEKAGQLTQYFYFRLPLGAEPGLEFDADEQPKQVESALKQGGAGSLLFVTDPAETNRLQRQAIEGNRLGIPVLFGYDVIHGLRTILPVPIGMAASWDPADHRAWPVGRRPRGACRRYPLDVRADGRHRARSTVGPDRRRCGGRPLPRRRRGRRPGHAASRAVSWVHPTASSPVRSTWPVTGRAIGGRDYDEVNLSDSELWNVYFPPFKAAVDAGAGNVMTAYMGLNGVPAGGNRWLFTEVLRDTWGFDGFVVSDANVVRSLVTHRFATDLTDGAARAINAGVDMEMAIADPAYAHLPEALESGEATRADDRRERPPGPRGKDPDGSVRRAVRG